MHGESSRAAGVLPGGLLHSGSADETAPQRHRISRPQAPRRLRQPSARNIRRRQVKKTPPSKEFFHKFMECGMMVVPQMSGAPEHLKNISLGLIGALFAVYAMEFWMRRSCKAKWKVTIFRIVYNSIRVVALYLLPCILKPGWLTWYGIVTLCIIATGYTCFDELNVTSQNASALYQQIKTKFTWCCEKGVLVISYVIDKVLKPIRKDQVSPALAPTRACI